LVGGRGAELLRGLRGCGGRSRGTKHVGHGGIPAKLGRLLLLRRLRWGAELLWLSLGRSALGTPKIRGTLGSRTSLKLGTHGPGGLPHLIHALRLRGLWRRLGRLRGRSAKNA